MEQSKWIITGEVPTKKIQLDDDFWVETKTTITAGQYQDFMASKSGKNGSDETTAWTPQNILGLMLVDWNFTDENGEKLPLNKKTLANLTMQAVSLLVVKVSAELGVDSPFDVEAPA